MKIRRAEKGDIEGLNKLLYQVHEIHRKGRPDLFGQGTKKYTDEELESILRNDKTPVFAAAEGDRILGYAFCILRGCGGDDPDMKTMYIDDLCVDEILRGGGIGKKLYEYVLDFAKKCGCYNVTLNVWACNDKARKFYEKCGLEPQKTCMEKIL